MYKNTHITVIIPTLDEELSIGKVIVEIPTWVDRVIVADNGSGDRSVEIARMLGAEVVHARERGYGSACKTGMAFMPRTDIIVFLDADYSDDATKMDQLVQPIIENRTDIVLGSRVLGYPEPGSLTLLQRWGNWLATRLIFLFWNVHYTDLGPFRAIRYQTLMQLGMTDEDYGWTVELQIKAARQRVRCMELPVAYRRRIGRSKISGSVGKAVAAGLKIIWLIMCETVRSLIPHRNHQNLILLFTRLPEPGISKTRLIPALGLQGAACLHKDMMTRTLRMVEKYCTLNHVAFEVRLAGADDDTEHRYFRDDNFKTLPQGPGNLGFRLRKAFNDAFDEGYIRVLAIGTDTPALEAQHFDQAFRALERKDAVIGPVEDGGYYLIGSSRRCPTIFDHIDWGTGEVHNQTIRQFQLLGLTWQALESLHDIDHPEDLPIWTAVTGQKIFSDQQNKSTLALKAVDQRDISVIIPALNEESVIGETIQAVCGAGLLEVIVVDGSSSDSTVSVALSGGARVIRAPRGRALQMNRGGVMARGDYLLFLHADTLPPDGYARTIRETLDHENICAGAFKFSINRRGLRYRLIEIVTHWRAKYFQIPYGDQGLFMTRSMFERSGGFPEISFMDDLKFIRELRRFGNIKIASTPAKTSPRRWVNLGTFRTTLINQVILIGHILGVKPEKLKMIYGKRPGTRDGKSN